MAPCSSSVCFTNEAGCITRHSEGYLRLTWLPGSECGSAGRVTLEHLLVELEQVRWGKVLIDQRQMMPLSVEDSTWLMLDWLPRATQHNLYRHVAIWSATNVFCRLASHSMTLQSQHQFPVVYRHFEAEEVAVAWLLAQS